MCSSQHFRLHLAMESTLKAACNKPRDFGMSYRVNTKPRCAFCLTLSAHTHYLLEKYAYFCSVIPGLKIRSDLFRQCTMQIITLLEGSLGISESDTSNPPNPVKNTSFSPKFSLKKYTYLFLASAEDKYLRPLLKHPCSSPGPLVSSG